MPKTMIIGSGFFKLSMIKQRHFCETQRSVIIFSVYMHGK